MQRQGGNQQQYSPQQPGTQQVLSQLQQQQQQQSQFGQQVSQQPPQTTTTAGGIFSSFTGGGQQSNQQQQQLFSGQNQGFQPQSRIQHKGVPQVLPNVMVSGGPMSNNPQQQGNNATAPNLMQKLNEITAPGGDILSKGKELIFMKFGLGGK